MRNLVTARSGLLAAVISHPQYLRQQHAHSFYSYCPYIYPICNCTFCCTPVFCLGSLYLEFRGYVRAVPSLRWATIVATSRSPMLEWLAGKSNSTFSYNALYFQSNILLYCILPRLEAPAMLKRMWMLLLLHMRVVSGWCLALLKTKAYWLKSSSKELLSVP